MFRLLLFILSFSLGYAADAQEGWMKIESGGVNPAPRRGAVGIVDAEQTRLVFHGGEAPGALFFSETWVYDLKTQEWNSLVISNPPARCHHTFLQALSGETAILFGGFPRTNELWQWDNLSGSWTDITPLTNNPAPRCLHSGVLDKRNNRMIVYGGLNGGFTPDLNDLWALDLSSRQWKRTGENQPPGFRYGHVAAMDETGNRMILFGGFMRNRENQLVNAGDTWIFDFNTQQWSMLNELNASPSPRQFAQGVNLPNGKGMILFGGLTDAGYQNDLWFFRYEDLTWHPIELNGTKPEPRFRHTLIMNEAENELILAFGAGNNNVHYADLWRLKVDLPDIQDESGVMDWAKR